MSNIVSEVNLRTVEIVEEIISSGNGNMFVTVPMVLTELLARYSICGLEVLGISLEDVPALKFLSAINQKIQLLLTCYVSENAILVLSDVESAVCANLRSFNFPSISAVKPMQKAMKTYQEIDPNEIDLEEVVSCSNAEYRKPDSGDHKLYIPVTFEHFGIGNLARHPTLMQYFPSQINVSRSDISTQDCLNILTESICNQSNSVSFESFISAICSHYGTDNLSELGIFINSTKFGNLAQTLSDMAKLSSARKNLSVRNFFAQTENSFATETMSTKRVEKKVFIQSLVLKTPQDSSVYPIYKDVGNYFKEKSAFSPSVSAIRKYLEQNYSSSSSNPSKKRKVDSHSTNEDFMDSKNPLIGIAAEYFLLHYGNKRDVSKRYDLTVAEDVIIAEKGDQDKGTVEGQQNASNQEPIEISLDKENGKDVVISANTINKKSSCNSSLVCSYQIPFEANRFSSSMSLPQYLQDEAASLIWHISNDQLRDILVDIQIPPFPPSAATTNSGFDTKSPVKPQEIVVAQQIGRIGECIVYHYLKQRFHSHLSSDSKSPMYHVEWLNQFEDNRAAYDLTIDPSSTVGGGRVFVEVKSSRYDENNVFQLSLWEWQFLTQQPTVNYHIYRVFSVQDRTKTRITVLTNVRRLVEMGRVQLCLSI